MVEQKFKEIKIGNYIDLLTGFPFPSNNYSHTGIRLLRGSNIKRGYTDWSEEITKFWKSVTTTLKKYSLEEGDIVIAMDGSLVGKSFSRLTKDDIPSLLLQRVARIRSGLIDMNYLKEWVCSDFFTKHCNSLKTASAIPHIAPKDIQNFSINLPDSKEEQHKIAEKLLETENLIINLESLIQKKKNIKQGVMQELLTGKRRLEGFSVKWETKTLDEICIKDGLIRGPFGGNLKKEDFVNFGYKVYEQKNAIYKNISDGNYFVDENKFSKLKRFSVHSGDFILSCSGTIGKLFQIPKNAPSGIINQALLLLKINRDFIDEKFFTYYFEFDEFQQKIIDNTHGGAMQNLVSMNDFKKTSFQIPTNMKEQLAISQILSDMDEEINQLEKQLEKYTNLKQAMMQKLLTGEIRLV